MEIVSFLVVFVLAVVFTYGTLKSFRQTQGKTKTPLWWVVNVAGILISAGLWAEVIRMVCQVI